MNVITKIIIFHSLVSTIFFPRQFFLNSFFFIFFFFCVSAAGFALLILRRQLVVRYHRHEVLSVHGLVGRHCPMSRPVPIFLAQVHRPAVRMAAEFVESPTAHRWPSPANVGSATLVFGRLWARPVSGRSYRPKPNRLWRHPRPPMSP